MLLAKTQSIISLLFRIGIHPLQIWIFLHYCGADRLVYQQYLTGVKTNNMDWNTFEKRNILFSHFCASFREFFLFILFL